MDESYTWQKYYKILTEEQLRIPGLHLFGHNSRNEAMQPLKLHSHGNCIEITFLVRGMQIYSVNGKDYPFFGSSAFVCFPHEPHDSGGQPRFVSEFFWLQIDLSCEEDFLGLSADFARDLKNRLNGIPRRIIPFDPSLFKMIEKSFSLFASGRMEDKRHGSVILLSVLYQLTGPERDGFVQASPGIMDAMAYIHKNISEPISLDLLAQMSKLSLPRFKEKFQREMGISPREYINTLKIEKAKQILLVNPNVTETAYGLGFSSSNYFSSVFKKHTAMTPSKFIKKKLQSKGDS